MGEHPLGSLVRVTACPPGPSYVGAVGMLVATKHAGTSGVGPWTTRYIVSLTRRFVADGRHVGAGFRVEALALEAS